MLGNFTVGNAEAVITYVNPDTTVDYVDPSIDIFLDYDSKNKEFLGDNGETVTLSEVFSSTTVYSRVFTETTTIEDEISVATQYNLAFTDSISSSDAFLWTVSKNIVESISTGDTPDIGEIHHVTPADSVTVSDLMVTYHDGMLNTNMLNTRQISTGALEVLISDISVTLS